MNILHKQTDTHPAIQKKKTALSDAAADGMTEFMGSWSFLIIFFLFIGVWMALNLMAWAYKWDPYPFILLNLTLSCISAAQAPIILMSQNRQSDRDRITAKYDYAVNRKAEREIQAIQQELTEIKALLRAAQPKKRTTKKK